MSKSLSLSLGLRWEVAPPPKGEHGQDAYTLLGDFNARQFIVAPRGTPLWHTGWYNSLPVPVLPGRTNSEPGKELILRAGGGVFFDTSNRRRFALSTASASPTPRILPPALACHTVGAQRRSPISHPSRAPMHLPFRPSSTPLQLAMEHLRSRKLSAEVRR